MTENIGSTAQIPPELRQQLDLAVDVMKSIMPLRSASAC